MILIFFWGDSHGKKLKRIANELKNRIKFFSENFLPPELSNRFIKNAYISGGAIFSLYNGEDVKDYDMFLSDEDIVKDLYKHFESEARLSYSGGVRKGTYKGCNIIVTDNAISIGNYQIITRFIGAPVGVIGQFDFKHNQFYLEDGEIKTISGWKYLKEKKLYYNEDRARDICGTIIRVKKFVERGFKITNKEMAKMLLKLHKVGFNERELEILNGNDERNDFGS